MAASNTNVTPGWNQNSPTNSALKKVEAEIAGIGKDEFSGEIKPPLSTGVDRLVAIQSATWENRDLVQRMMSTAQEGLAVAADVGASNVPTSGYSAPGEYTGAVSAARKRVLDGAGTGSSQKVLSTRADPMRKLAEAASSALQTADKEIAWCVAQWEGPTLLGEDVQVTDLQKISAIVNEYKTRKTPCADALAFLRAAHANGMNKKQFGLFATAARELAIAITGAPWSHTGKAFSTEQAARANDDKNKAADLLRALDDLRRKDRPPSLDVGVRVLGALTAIFQELCGFSAARRYLSDDGVSKAAGTFAIDQNFPARFLPPHDDPPGWSPLTDMSDHMRSGGSVRIGTRKAK